MMHLYVKNVIKNIKIGQDYGNTMVINIQFWFPKIPQNPPQFPQNPPQSPQSPQFPQNYKKINNSLDK